MTDNIEYSTVLVELDALLDTRLGTIVTHHDELLEPILIDGYLDRDIDVFTGIDTETYQREYATRDSRTLSNSLVTPMANLLLEYCQKTIKQISSTPFHYKPKILLNIHPYKLSEDEIDTLICSLIELTATLADVEVVDMSYEDMTPKYMKDKIALVILYEYYKWLEVHSLNKNFESVTCPEVTMLGPVLYFKEPEDITKNPFAAMEKLAQVLVGLQLLPVSDFSFVTG